MVDGSYDYDYDGDAGKERRKEGRTDGWKGQRKVGRTEGGGWKAVCVYYMQIHTNTHKCTCICTLIHICNKCDWSTHGRKYRKVEPPNECIGHPFHFVFHLFGQGWGGGGGKGEEEGREGGHILDQIFDRKNAWI